MIEPLERRALLSAVSLTSKGTLSIVGTSAAYSITLRLNSSGKSVLVYSTTGTAT